MLPPIDQCVEAKVSVGWIRFLTCGRKSSGNIVLRNRFSKTAIFVEIFRETGNKLLT